MRLVVEGAGYRSAADAFWDGNLLAARTALSLADALGGYAAMAGDDATAADFAAAYDEAATAAVEVLGGTVSGFAALARLSEASLRNHTRAEEASVLRHPYAEPPPPSDRGTGVHVDAPPSALGGDSSSLPGWANAVLDLLEGVFWPDADTDRLRAAAGTWRTAATSVGLLSAHCSTALGELAAEVSPEVPLAVATTEDLRARVESLADQLAALAAACDEYAAQVDAKRAEILDALQQLAVELGVGAIIGGIATALTAGAAAPAAGAVGAGRVAVASAELRGILESLGLLSRGTAATLRPVSATLRDARAYLARLSAARTERGSANLAAFFSRHPSGLLARHEGAGRGHAMARHLEKSVDWLHQRALAHPHAKFASSFTDVSTADRAVVEVLRRRRTTVEAWLEDGDRLVLEGRLDRVIGISVSRTGEVLDARSVRIVLVRDPHMPEGFHIKTAYPKP